jgi:hypothetical protein
MSYIVYLFEIIFMLIFNMFGLWNTKSIIKYGTLEYDLKSEFYEIFGDFLYKCSNLCNT